MPTFEIAEVNGGVIPPNERSPWNLESSQWQSGKNIIFTKAGVQPFWGFTDLWPSYSFPQAILWISNIEDTILFLGKTKIFYSFNGAEPVETKYTQVLGQSNEGNTYTFSSHIYSMDAGTVKIKYIRGGATKYAWDKDSDGKLYEDGGANQIGTVNYTGETNQFSLDFSSVGAPDNETDITLSETKFTLKTEVALWKEFCTPNYIGFTSSIYKPLKWDNANSIWKTITDAPKARVMWYQDRHLLAAGGSQGENKLAWSDLDDPENWSTGESGYGFLDLDVADTIQLVTNIGGIFYIIAQRKSWMIQYIGYPGYWSVKPVLGFLGALSPNAIAEFGDEAILFMNDGAYTTTGMNIEPIENGLLHTLYEEINPNKLERFFSIFDEYTKTVFFFYNKDGGDYTEKTLLYNYDINVWSTLDIGKIQAAGFWRKTQDTFIDNVDIIIDECNTLIDATTFESNFPILIFVKNDGHCYELDYNKVSECAFLSGYIPLEENKIAQRRKLITDIQLKGSGRLKCKIGYMKYINSEIVWSDAQEYTFGEKEELEWATKDIEGKYMVLYFFTDSPMAFELTGYVFDYQYVGEE